jgi:hypothetical protein
MSDTRRKDTRSGNGSTGILVAIMFLLLALIVGSLYRFVHERKSKRAMPQGVGRISWCRMQRHFARELPSSRQR